MATVPAGQCWLQGATGRVTRLGRVQTPRVAVLGDQGREVARFPPGFFPGTVRKQTSGRFVEIKLPTAVVLCVPSLTAF